MAFTDMTRKQQDYMSYLLRLWRDSKSVPWRVSLESIPTGERRLFANVEALFTFLEARTGEEDKKGGIA